MGIVTIIYTSVFSVQGTSKHTVRQNGRDEGREKKMANLEVHIE